MSYIDAMVIPIPAAKLKDYKRLIKKSAEAWKRVGALAYIEAIADDVQPGKRTSFPQSLKLKPDEIAGIAYIIFESKSHRNKCWKLMMKDPFMKAFEGKTMPFDGKRMFFGGFKQIGGF
jgi:uncharacterized protein YbaA (DUF1428 family)